MWVTYATFGDPDDLLPVDITFDLEANYDLDSFKVWNYNELGMTDRGANNVEILIASSVGGAFTSLGNFTFTEAPGLHYVDFGQTIDLSSFSAAADARLVKFNITTSYGSTIAGLSEIRCDAVPEPATMSLLGLGGLLTLLRRKRSF